MLAVTACSLTTTSLYPDPDPDADADADPNADPDNDPESLPPLPDETAAAALIESFFA